MWVLVYWQKMVEALTERPSLVWNMTFESKKMQNVNFYRVLCDLLISATFRAYHLGALSSQLVTILSLSSLLPLFML